MTHRVTDGLAGDSGDDSPPQQRSARARSAGVLLHVSSLPGGDGIGDFGAGARAWLDWMAAAGLTRWQVLPLCPVGSGRSPYSSASAFALEPTHIDLVSLSDAGLLPDAARLQRPQAQSLDVVDEALLARKQELFLHAARARLAAPGGRAHVEACIEREPWMRDSALFFALREASSGAPWWTWDAALARYDQHAVRQAHDQQRERVLQLCAQQVMLAEQWQAVRDHARARGIRIIGDLPIYVDHDSADVWANRALFCIDDQLRPTERAGVPPDAFSDLGQLWGNPLYDWAHSARTADAWWVARLRRALSLFDIVRVDHFRAFADYWAVPLQAADAREGTWKPGPGRRPFDAAARALMPEAVSADGPNPLPIVAEDLGIITKDVVALRDSLAWPGMNVLQFAFGQGPDAAYLPHNHVANSVVYTGTHDNNTTLGFWNEASDSTRDHIRRYLGVDGHNIVWDLIRCAFASVSNTAIVPMQDILSLDAGARMNTPSLPHGNWRWRVRQAAFHHDMAQRVRELSALFGRLG